MQGWWRCHHSLLWSRSQLYHLGGGGHAIPNVKFCACAFAGYRRHRVLAPWGAALRPGLSAGLRAAVAAPSLLARLRRLRRLRGVCRPLAAPPPPGRAPSPRPAGDLRRTRCARTRARCPPCGGGGGFAPHDPDAPLGALRSTSSRRLAAASRHSSSTLPSRGSPQRRPRWPPGAYAPRFAAPLTGAVPSPAPPPVRECLCVLKCRELGAEVLSQGLRIVEWERPTPSGAGLSAQSAVPGVAQCASQHVGCRVAASPDGL